MNFHQLPIITVLFFLNLIYFRHTVRPIWQCCCFNMLQGLQTKCSHSSRSQYTNVMQPSGHKSLMFFFHSCLIHPFALYCTWCLRPTFVCICSGSARSLGLLLLCSNIQCACPKNDTLFTSLQVIFHIGNISVFHINSYIRVQCQMSALNLVWQTLCTFFDSLGFQSSSVEPWNLRAVIVFTNTTSPPCSFKHNSLFCTHTFTRVHSLSSTPINCVSRLSNNPIGSRTLYGPEDDGG